MAQRRSLTRTADGVVTRGESCDVSATKAMKCVMQETADGELLRCIQRDWKRRMGDRTPPGRNS